MGGQTEATRQSDYITPPMVGTDGKLAGAVFATSTTVATLDLSTVPVHPTGFPVSEHQTLQNIAAGLYIQVTAESADLYVLFGPTVGSVSGANAPVATTNGTNVVGLGYYIPAGTKEHFKLPAGPSSPGAAGQNSPARFIGVVTRSGAGQCRITPTSPSP